MQGHGQEEHLDASARDAEAAGAMTGLVARLPVPVWLFDTELQVTYANQASLDFSSPRGAQSGIEDFSPDVQRVLTAASPGSMTAGSHPPSAASLTGTSAASRCPARWWPACSSIVPRSTAPRWR